MKRLLSFSLIAALLVGTSAFADNHNTPFSDVDSTQIYYSAIVFLKDQGIVAGDSDSENSSGLRTFRPEDTLGRAEMLKIVAETQNTNNSSSFFNPWEDKKCFDDVPTNEWYTKYVCYGKAQGWVVGYDNPSSTAIIGQNFLPGQDVTFPEALKMTLSSMDIPFQEDQSPWYESMVRSVSEDNWIPHTISSFGAIQRDQMADMLTRIIKGSESESELLAYLGDRSDLVSTYETIEAGQPPVDGVIFQLDPRTEVIEITADGFSPSNVTISPGDIIHFVNRDADSHWPASDNHPTHTVYPGSGISKCGTLEADEIFDSCTALNTNEVYEFTFTEVGNWEYHDHLNPSLGGTITVSE